jgi:hypothetical protein
VNVRLREKDWSAEEPVVVVSVSWMSADVPTGASLTPTTVTATSWLVLPPCPSCKVTVKTSVSLSPTASDCACALLAAKTQLAKPDTELSDPVVSASTPAAKLPRAGPDFTATETECPSAESASLNDSVPPAARIAAWISSMIVADAASPAPTVMRGASFAPFTVKVSVR